MVARLGVVRDRCFAHFSVGNCSPETYLHVLGKYLFSKAFRDCVRDGRPYCIGRRREVCSDVYIGEYYVGRTPASIVPERIDLCRFYDAVETERGVGGFIADLLLRDTRSKKKPICIEIKVTHGLTEKKRQSGQQIIEIAVASERDLLSLENADVPEELAEWVLSAEAPKVLIVQSSICELSALFGGYPLSHFRTVGDKVTVQIYWNEVKQEYVAVREEVILGTGLSVEAAADAAGCPLSPISPPQVISPLRERPSSRAEASEITDFLVEVLAVFGGQLPDD